jgi:energy-coupling factor transporter ATP-binding protein EcfA2
MKKGPARLERDSYRLFMYEVRNFMGIKNLHLELDEKQRLVMFTGRNGAGKTTAAATALAHALGGNAWEVQKPQREGAAQGWELNFVFNGSKRKLFMSDSARGLSMWIEENGQRLKVTSPLDLIREIVDPLCFDPLQFMTLEPEDQVERLQNTLHIDELVDAINQEEKDDTQARKALNVEVEDIERRIRSYVAQELPAAKHDIEKLRADIAAADEHNSTVVQQITERMRLQTALEAAEANATRNQELIEDTEERLKASEAMLRDGKPVVASANKICEVLDDLVEKVNALPDSTQPAYAVREAHTHMRAYVSFYSEKYNNAQAQAEQGKLALKAAKAQVKPLEQAVEAARQDLENAPSGAMIDVRVLREAIQKAEAENREIDKRTIFEQNQALLKSKLDERKTVQDRLDGYDARRTDAIAEAVRAGREEGLLPAGLTFSSEEVQFDGLPLKQHGQAQQMRIAITLALASKPQLPLVCIPQGEALDDESLLELQKMAEERGFYVFMARVDSSGEVGIVMEQGEVKAQKPVPFR